MTSYKPEVQTGHSDEWSANTLRFATRAEAEAYAFNLMCRWTAVRDTRVVESADAVNYAWTDSGAMPLWPEQRDTH